MTNNKKLVEKMVRSGVLVSSNITKAFDAVDRKDFVKSEYLEKTYDDAPLPIGFGQTISQPSTVAFMLERLQPKSGEKVLDVGSGSGWTTALLSHLVGGSGEVFGIERLDPLVKLGRVNLKKYGGKSAVIIKAEQDYGYKSEAPFNKILVSAAAQEVPQSLVDQLTVGGVMVLPVKSSICKITKTSKNDFKQDEYYGFSFVPLVQDIIEDNI